MVQIVCVVGGGGGERKQIDRQCLPWNGILFIAQTITAILQATHQPPCHAIQRQQHDDDFSVHLPPPLT